jgi:uncharacterized protein YegJ (DUF2314 family)
MMMIKGVLARWFAAAMAAAGVVAVCGVLGGCAARDTVVSVEAADPEMAAAIAKARQGLPEFWAAWEAKAEGNVDFAVKVPLAEGDSVEHFWITDIQRQDGKVSGRLDNEPKYVKRVKRGDRVAAPEAEIEDWLYFRGGKMVGNETLKPLMKELPPADVERLKAMMADPPP